MRRGIEGTKPRPIIIRHGIVKKQLKFFLESIVADEEKLLSLLILKPNICINEVTCLLFNMGQEEAELFKFHYKNKPKHVI